jgi:hypothetical protein
MKNKKQKRNQPPESLLQESIAGRVGGAYPLY